MNIPVSPTDSPLAKKIGEDAIISPLPEQYGADVLLFTNQGLFGIQRKEFPNDFIASMNDGRLARETTLLAAKCKYRIILCEGKPRYYPDGTLIMPKEVKARYSRKRVRGAILNIKYVKGVDVDFTEDMDDTVSYIKELAEFFKDQKHFGLYVRPSAPSDWVAPTGRDIDLWILQSFEGIGPSLASNIIEHFGGKNPLKWGCTLEQLKSVPRLPHKLAEEIYNQLESDLRKPDKPMTYQDKLKGLLNK